MRNQNQLLQDENENLRKELQIVNIKMDHCLSESESKIHQLSDMKEKLSFEVSKLSEKNILLKKEMKD